MAKRIDPTFDRQTYYKTHQPLDGKVFGSWTVLYAVRVFTGIKKVVTAVEWMCRCKCGTERHVCKYGLLSGESRSCGCLYILDLTGKVFGLWTVIGKSTTPTTRGVYWDCCCVCGKTARIGTHSLISGKSKSCHCSHYVDPTLKTKKRMYSNYQHYAKSCGRLFALTFEQFDQIITSPCLYCDVKDGHEYKLADRPQRFTGSFIGNGVDRYDNDLGYVLSNCVPCCERCNMSKKTLHGDDFIKMCRTIAVRHSPVVGPRLPQFSVVGA